MKKRSSIICRYSNKQNCNHFGIMLLLFVQLNFVISCTKQFELKEEFLENTKILKKDISSQNEQGCDYTLSSCDGPTPSNPDGPTPSNPDASSQIKIKVLSMCSDGMTVGMPENKGVDGVMASLKRSTAFKLVLKEVESSKEVCKIENNDDLIRGNIINNPRNRVLDLSGCPHLSDGNYIVSLITKSELASVGDVDLLYEGTVEQMWFYYNSRKEYNRPAGIKFQISQGKVIFENESQSCSAEFCHTSTIYKHVLVDGNPVYGNGNPDDCDGYYSPLAVQIYKNEHLGFSSILEGIFFDLLGMNSFPNPFSPIKIGWIDNPSIMFIVRPDSNGKVQGINEMFGDNTFGPDGKFAANGFLALQKFDGVSSDGKKIVSEPDGFINKDDEIFNELRLWSDENLNGIAEISELHKFEKFGIESLDLRYDPKYFERDEYNNQIRYKSVAKKTNGELLLIFDIWFHSDADTNIRNNGFKFRP